MFRTVYLTIFISLLVSCSQTVARYDERYHNKLHRKGFISQTISLKNHEVFYYDNRLENRPTLVLIHGFGADGKVTWKKQIEALHEDYRIITPDLLWFGKSISSAEPSLLAQIDAVASLIQLIKPNNVHLVGISYGGFVTLGIAALHPKIAQSITIVDSPGVFMEDEDVKDFNASVGVDDIKDAFVPKNEEELSRLIDFSFYKKPYIPNWLLPQILATYFSQHPKEQAVLIDELNQHREKLSGKVKPPLYIIWGEYDEIFKLEIGRALKDHLEAEMTVIENAGHAVNVEQAKAFNKALKNWLDRFHLH